MKTAIHSAKVPFGKGKFSKVKNVRYLSWEDAFDVEFADGLCILEPHATIRKANRIPLKAKFDHLEIELIRIWFLGAAQVLSAARVKRDLPARSINRRRSLHQPRRPACWGTVW